MNTYNAKGGPLVPDFAHILEEHRARWPLMEPRDFVKLAYQAEFGPEHLLTDPRQLAERLLAEWSAVPADAPVRPPEPIGGGLVRFHLNHIPDPEALAQAAGLLAQLFVLTARAHTGTAEGLMEKLALLRTLDVPGMEAYLTQYTAVGCPAVHHSDTYRDAYAPAYRLLPTDWANWFTAIWVVWMQLSAGEPLLLSIDGQCGSGKSRLAAVLERLFDCEVFHMDDYYLPADRRAEDWMDTPAGNMDLARVEQEVLRPFAAGEPLIRRRYDCQSGVLGAPETLAPAAFVVLEGSYSQHPALAAYAGLKLFLTCPEEERRRRLMAREGGYFPTFERLWMPLEERYHAAFGLPAADTLVLDTGSILPD